MQAPDKRKSAFTAEIRFDFAEISSRAYNFVDKSSFMIAEGGGPARWLWVS